jgi:hypothetical protein
MARVVREDWPHVDMDMGKRQVGEGKWAGEEGTRAGAHAAGADPSRFTPLPRAPSPDSAASVGGAVLHLQCRVNYSFVFFAVRSAVCAGLRAIRLVR